MERAKKCQFLDLFDLIYCALTARSAIFQLYHGDQFSG